MSRSRIRSFHPTKLILILLSLWILSACSLPAATNAPDEISFIVNGEKLKTAPAVAMDKDEIMVPGDFIEKTFKVKLEWALKNTADNGIYYSNKAAVLMYHDITEQPRAGKSEMTSTLFKEQMELLKADGFHIISLNEYADFILNDGSVPDNAVLITFDDGYESFYKDAFPILKEYGYPAVNFIIVSTVGDASLKGEPKMTWDQMREMQKSGMDFYSHTYDLHHYGVMREDGLTKPVMTRKQYFKDEKRTETEEEYTKRITDDLAAAEQKIKEELNNPRGVVAFPYGAYNEQVLEIMKSLGIELSFTVKPGLNAKGQTNGYRINGAKEGESAKQLIEKLKSLDLPDAPVSVSVNGQAATFSDAQAFKGKDDVMIPLREYCKQHNIEMKWDSKKKLVTLHT